MTAYEFGDVLLLPFPFTDQSGVKKGSLVFAVKISIWIEI